MRSKTIHQLYKAFGVGGRETTIAVWLALFLCFNAVLWSI